MNGCQHALAHTQVYAVSSQVTPGEEPELIVKPNSKIVDQITQC